MSKNMPRVAELRDLCEALIVGADVGIRANVPTGTRAPHILNVTLPSIKSQTMLNFLSAKGIYVSSGSACSSHSSKPSSSLVAFGLSVDEADTSLRISFSEYNTEDDVHALVDVLKLGSASLVKIKR